MPFSCPLAIGWPWLRRGGVQVSAMRPLSLLTSLLLGALLVASATAESPRQRISFNKDWRFQLGDHPGAEAANFDHQAWRQLDLPHDWSAEGKFDENESSGAQGGYLPTGIGWYRKEFVVPESAAAGVVLVDFDAIYMNGEVWINGVRLGKRPYGYTGVRYDLTPHLKFGESNVIAVRVDNSLQPSTRWYSGSGIYRHTWLITTDKLRVAHWGTQVSTPEINETFGVVKILTTLRNDHDRERTVTLNQSVKEEGMFAETEEEVTVGSGAEVVVEQELMIPRPKLWSPDSPNLYAIRTELRDGDRAIGQYHTPLGFRTVTYDAQKGMFLNGQPIIMKGTCNHSDLGPLGAALWNDALERRLLMLKAMGCNALRTAHNPPSPDFLEMCDRLGFLVINETFDEWRRGWSFENGRLVSSKGTKGKAKFGYNRYFDEWARQDLTDHIRRDRNHPSVIMWSVGNEVPEAQRHGELETLKWMRELCHELDPTRPMTVGCNFIQGANETGFTEHMDIVGYNGGGGSCFEYENDKKKFPHRLMYASEVPHSLHTRGEYRTHTVYREMQHAIPNLTEEEVFPETDGWYESSYDNAGVRINARDSWRLTKTLPYFMGEFRWTGFDYIGESGGWPRVLGNFGIIDLCNFPKDTYYFYQSQWTEKPMAHLLPHWNWPGKEGVEIPVWCYTNAEEAELFLNGKSLGVKTFTKEHDMHLQWMVPYQAGELKVVAKRGGKVVAQDVRRTAGAPARVVLESDREVMWPGSRKLAYVTIRLEDKDGNFVPDGAKWVKLSVEGPARIVGVHNGDPLSHTPFISTTVRTFNGLALVILASDDQAEESHRRHLEWARSRNQPVKEGVHLRAYSKGLESEPLSLGVEEEAP